MFSQKRSNIWRHALLSILSHLTQPIAHDSGHEELVTAATAHGMLPLQWLMLLWCLKHAKKRVLFCHFVSYNLCGRLKAPAPPADGPACMRLQKGKETTCGAPPLRTTCSLTLFYLASNKES